MDRVLYRPSWQKLRISCIQDFNPFRGFQTVDGTTDNLNRLNNYINDASPYKSEGAAKYAADEAYSMSVSLETEYNVRIYRVWNFIHSVINGLASLHLQHMPQITSFYDALNMMVNTAPVVEMANNWNWGVVDNELKIMWINERVWFTRIYDDMKQRVVEKDQTGADMLHFKSLMDAIITY